MAPRFPGFKKALSRLLRFQWEGKKGGFTAKKDNQTRLCPLQGRRISDPFGTYDGVVPTSYHWVMGGTLGLPIKYLRRFAHAAALVVIII